MQIHSVNFETMTEMDFKRHNWPLDVKTNAEGLADLCSEFSELCF